MRFCRTTSSTLSVTCRKRLTRLSVSEERALAMSGSSSARRYVFGDGVHAGSDYGVIYRFRHELTEEIDAQFAASEARYVFLGATNGHGVT
jgi:hypothetical protein